MDIIFAFFAFGVGRMIALPCLVYLIKQWPVVVSLALPVWFIIVISEHHREPWFQSTALVGGKVGCLLGVLFVLVFGALRLNDLYWWLCDLVLHSHEDAPEPESPCRSRRPPQQGFF
jgi:hypothetical protein